MKPGIIVPAHLVYQNMVDTEGFPGGSVVKKEMATHSSILVWKQSMDRGAWWATVHGVAESDMTEITHHDLLNA